MFDLTETGCQDANDLPSISGDPDVEHFGNPRPFEPLRGVSATCPDPMWSIEPNMVHHSNFHISTIPTPSVNHGSNPPISSHTITPRHQWGTGVHLPTNGLSQNNFGAIPSFLNLVDSADAMQQNSPSSIARNGQSNYPAFEIWGADGG